MTPAEFALFIAAQRRRDEREWERTAWLVSHMYAPHMRRGKKAPTVDKLLGRKRTRG